MIYNVWIHDTTEQVEASPSDAGVARPSPGDQEEGGSYEIISGKMRKIGVKA